MKQAIAIAGGGIGGLALARRGFACVVLEQAKSLREAAKRHGLVIERMLMMDAVSGEPVVDIPCGDAFVRRFGQPYVVAHRADVHGALLEGCRASGLVELRTSSRVVGFSLRNGVAVHLDGGEVQAAALVGADGVHSAVRKQLLADGDPQPAGAMIYRAVIPAADMPRDLQHPWPTLWVGSRADFDDGSEAPLEEALPLFSASGETPLCALRAAQALEDAAALADAVASSPNDLAEAFQRYERARIVRASRVQISSLMMHHLMHAAGIERLVRNSIFAGRTPEQHYERLAWLYGPN